MHEVTIQDSHDLGHDLIRYGWCMNQASASIDGDLVHGLFPLQLVSGPLLEAYLPDS